MDIWGKYKSALGYQNNDCGIDSFGVNHNSFSLRDELAYQMARSNREQELIQNYNNQGITKDYPQYGTNFWGSSPENNYGFGVSNIENNIENVTKRLKNSEYSNQTQQGIGEQHKMRNIENNLLMNGMDTMYGMNRAINGMTFGGLDWLGNKFGFDSQMNGYLNLKNDQNRNLTQMAGNAAELGGAALTGGALAKAGYNQANMAYNGYKIGKSYDKLLDNPYQGNGRDVIARMKNHNGEPVILQRGEAIPDANGNIVVHGKALERETGTLRNYGLNKGIYRHGISRADAQRIPRIIRQKPVELSHRGQYVYNVPSRNGNFKVVTSPTTNNETVVVTTYYPIE